MNEKESEYIDILKGISIFMVICAHCNNISNNGSNMITQYGHLLLTQLGTGGVGMFLIISGYLTKKRNSTISLNDIERFLLSLVRVIIPWIISGTIVYLYVHLRKPPISLEDLLYFLVGNGSYLYYLLMFVIFKVSFFTFQTVLSRKYILVILIITSFISILYFPTSIFPSPYLNPFNWCGYYALGILLQNNKSLLRQISSSALLTVSVWISTLFWIAYQLLQQREGSYWYFSGFIGCCLLGGSIALLAHYINKSEFLGKSLMIKIGKQTLFIYLWHMPIAGIIANLMNNKALNVFIMIRPFIVLAIMFFALKIITLISDNNIFRNYRWTIGISKR